MPVDQPTLLIKNLSFSFGKQKVLKDLSLEINQGEIFALIGPNGAGKSTLLRIISGLLPIQRGSIHISNASISEHPQQAKANQMILTDNPEVYPFLTGNEFLTMHAALRDISQTKLQSTLAKVATIFPEKLPLDKPLGEQSRGTRQKIHIIAAMLTQPNLLVFDEPIVGLDPTSIKVLGKLIQDFVTTKNKNDVKPSVILALHTLDFAQEYAQKVGILTQGSLVGVKTIGSTDIFKHYQKHTSKK